MIAFTIVQPGLHTTFQDYGRRGFAHLGVPTSGPMDFWHAQKALDAIDSRRSPCGVVLESALLGPTIRFESSMQVAISGAAMRPRLNGRSVIHDTAVFVAPGDELQLSHADKGVFSYIAFSRRLNLEVSLGSYSTLTSAQMGGYQGRCLQKGDRILAAEFVVDGEPEWTERDFSRQASVQLAVPGQLVKLPVRFGPEFDVLQSSQHRQSVNTASLRSLRTTVGSGSSRMAIVLESIDAANVRVQESDAPHTEMQESQEMPSSGVFPGVVQLNHAGQLMVLMRDGPTTGGYPRVAVMDEPTTWQLAQCPPGTIVEFEFSP